ncbi:WD40 domain protein beta Propeller [Anaeromyxobacter sp. K]|uniref:BamA/TamA family outer membrane protein n=1 Tax=Anaeromyxobacter sp. (strain K) TaxID=447217 RepID=UPI00015F8332|nr:BamA/TamA family outer membrane protein [Anaeromyxobacter sp. K]ACG73329.1 WD40 domain protein beta Propeller [Anaeromyxobacter sp. K]
MTAPARRDARPAGRAPRRRAPCTALALAFTLSCACASGTGVAALLALALAPAPARAQLYDPGFSWRTIETPHFRVHHHQGEEALAQEVARAAERAHAILSPVLGFAPRERTEIVLSDDTDDANGLATPLPYDTIRLYAVPPPGLSELNDYRDWVSSLVFHEYVHILHLDHVGGLPALANAVFGKLFVPNGLTPSWMAEGLAVLHEADGEAVPGAGRNASAIHDMYARALALDGPFPRLDQISNPLLEWPLGTAPYLLGGRFMAFLRARYGDAAIAAFVADQGSQVWPYAPSWAGARAFGGRDFPSLWAEYAEEERRHAEAVRARVRERPVTAPTRLTRAGGRVETPRWSPDGSFLAYQKRDLDRRPGTYRVTPGGADLGLALTVDANGALSMASPREAVVAIGEVWRLHRTYDDLWAVDLARGARRRLTDGERAGDPAVVPGGGAVVYVRHEPGGRMALVRRTLPPAPMVPADVTIRERRAELAVPPPAQVEVLFARPGAQVYGPAPSPDGRRIAFELQEGGRRDVALWEDGAVRRVTDDDALDTGPAWTPDGRYLLFASDRGGVYDLYAWEAATGALRQVTNVESGAFQPAVSPDGRTIAFVTFGREGYDVATLPFDPAAWLEPTPAPPAPAVAGTAPATPPGIPVTTPGATAAQPATAAPSPAAGAPAAPTEPLTEPPAAIASTTTSPPSPSPTPLPSRPYRALDTVGPRWWLPLWGSDGAGSIYGAMTGGVDVLARHAWALQAWWSEGGREPGYAFSYQGGWSWPTLDLASVRYFDSAPGGRGVESVWTPVAAGLGFSFPGLAETLSFRIGWAGTSYDVLGETRRAPTSDWLEWRDGVLSEASFRAVYTDARRYVRSISPEEGRTVALSLRAADPTIGSDFGLARARLSVAQYLRVPGTRHTVLALRLSGGVAEGSIGGRAPYELGGAATVDPVAVVMQTAGVAPDQLRGYPYGWLAGTAFALGNLELRFPLLAPVRGYSTWPVFLRRVHGSVFVDAGDAFDLPGELPFAGHPFSWNEVRFAAGAELRAELVLGYWLRTDLRLGLAHGFGRLLAGEWREPGVDPVTAYVTVGQSF